ncbi:translation initiation factor IF-2 [Anaerobutyricum soehngenii]|uniref:translation initiation factor IF-2 n=1 Tax=Anaerobutyricum soehngenii TaxID=105843 RepID=UPI001C110FC7|nr:translation initiation factor IF-2 [Anaerobutyricum soehngenii]MBU5417185.1 translation initiation factor IF-2 [Anaerobutyricum soehngenii]
MPKMRVHEVAKLLDKSSKEIITKLKEQGVEVQSHMSTVSDENVEKLKAEFQKKESGNNRGNNDNRGNRNDNRGNRNDNRGDNRNNNRNNDNRDNRGDNRNNNRNNDNRGNRNDNRGNRNDNRGDNRNNRGNNDNRGGRNDNRGDNRNNNRGGNDRRNKSSMGDTPINAKETRNGKENRHDINREHSRDNKENNRNENRGGKNNRRNNRNNDFGGQRKQKNNKKQQQAPVQPPKQEEPKEDVIRNITLPDPVSLKDLADACKIQPSVIIKKLFMAGQMVTINTEFSFDDAAEIALEYNCIAEEEVKVDVIEELLKEEEEDERNLTSRPPVVCVMGHVDHGKTSLLDAIRSTHVTAGEAGGITQHIGAYVVEINGEKITFLDTPGHEAFTSMRLRGAQATDIAVLVVAADDGVMPQTIEAINHAKAAEVEVIVAVNKIDKEGANVDRVKQELTEYGLIAEDWGGSTVFVPVSAKTGEGINELLEMISLTAEVLELKANAKRRARGLVIEAKLDKGRGPVATILIQKGTLHVGDSINVGHAFGRVRAMMDDKGNRVKAAGPSTPVEILGLNDVPFSGEVLMAHGNEKEARATADAFIAYGREKMLEETKNKLSLDDLFDQIQAGNVKELNLVVKADVQGSVEAVKQSLMKLSNEEVMIKVVHGGVGAINESDVILASASNAIIIGFNVRPDAMAKAAAEREKVDMRLYRVIYNAIEDIEAAIKGMLDPVYREKVIGHVEVRQIYKASGVGTIAGCYVLDGSITKDAQSRIVRDGIVIYEGELASLKRFKDDVKEVKSGFECGIVFEKYNDIKEGDQIEAFVMEEIPR